MKNRIKEVLLTLFALVGYAALIYGATALATSDFRVADARSITSSGSHESAPKASHKPHLDPQDMFAGDSARLAWSPARERAMMDQPQFLPSPMALSVKEGTTTSSAVTVSHAALTTPSAVESAIAEAKRLEAARKKAEKVRKAKEKRRRQRLAAKRQDEKDSLVCLGEFTITYYCCEPYAHVCGGGQGLTESGRPQVAYQSIAVDKHVIPLGTTVYLDHGDGNLQKYSADDTGSNIQGARIDVAVQYHQEALNLGVNYATVYIVP